MGSTSVLVNPPTQDDLAPLAAAPPAHDASGLEPGAPSTHHDSAPVAAAPSTHNDLVPVSGAQSLHHDSGPVPDPSSHSVPEADRFFNDELKRKIKVYSALSVAIVGVSAGVVYGVKKMKDMNSSTAYVSPTDI